MEPGLVIKIRDIVLSTDDNHVRYCEQLKRYLEDNGFGVDEKQVIAWKDCFNFLKIQCALLDERAMEIPLLFEYMLPYEKGRRPDVIMLFENKVIVLEFKMTGKLSSASTEQALGYREDLKHFHSETAIKGMDVEGYLVWTVPKTYEKGEIKSIKILTESNFAEVIKESIKQIKPCVDVAKWYMAEYIVLPSMITAVNELFEKGKLPYIKNISDGDISVSLNKINGIIDIIKRENGKAAIVVDGVPGSGKTLVGLKTVYDQNKNEHKSMYLSGNGPLINVLQAQLSTGKSNLLDGKAYIKSMRAFKNEYIDKNNIPNQTIIVFDEAQRAWDSNKMNKPFNEIEGIINVCNSIHRKQGYVVLLCLYGGGQAIYKGEEKGLKLWDVVIDRYEGWNFYFSGKLAKELRRPDKVNRLSQLHLDTSIRNYFTDTSDWAESVVKRKGGNLNTQKAELRKIEIQNFRVRISRSFEEIKKVMPFIKHTQPNSKYGVLVSSYVETEELKKHSNQWIQSSYIRENDAAKWFNGQCEELRLAASEFLSQGLELEMPIVMFGGDYYLDHNEWKTDGKINAKNINKFDNFGQILENVYRVLLSRGRRGLILYIPNERKFHETYKRFKDMGIEDLVPQK